MKDNDIAALMQETVFSRVNTDEELSLINKKTAFDDDFNEVGSETFKQKAEMALKQDTNQSALSIISKEIAGIQQQTSSSEFGYIVDASPTYRRAPTYVPESAFNAVTGDTVSSYGVITPPNILAYEGYEPSTDVDTVLGVLHEVYKRRQNGSKSN